MSEEHPIAIDCPAMPSARGRLMDLFTCSTCPAVHRKSCASDAALAPEERREVLLELEPDAIADGWSIGADHDHCPRCAAALGLTTTRTP